MAKGDKVSASDKMEDYENLAKLISKGEQIPENLLPLLLEVYQSSTELQNEDNGALVPKEYELIYAEKRRKEEILSTTKAAPLQKVRTFNNGNKLTDDWENKLILGDNLKVLKSLADDPNVRGKVNLIYIDPPFATKRDFMQNEVKAYEDKVVGSAFIEFLRKRLIFMRELLADDGLIYIHLDMKKMHYIKVIADEIFGEHNFRNEIVWGYKTGGVSTRFWPRKHDTLLMYSKGSNWTHNAPKKREWYEKPFMNLAFLVPEHLNAKEKTEIIKALDSNQTLNDKFKNKLFKQYYADVYVRDVWDHDETKTEAAASSGYPTQKPEGLLERVIRTSSNEGDLVLDAFAGSGTTLAVAEKLGRKWIGIDCGKLSIYTIQSRMLGLYDEIGNKGKALKHKPFAVFNAGLYDYKAIEAMDFSAYRDFILQLFQVRDKKHQINGVDVDGMFKTRSVLLWKHKDEKNLTINEGYLQSLHDALGGKGGSIFYLIAPNSAFSFPEDYKPIGDTEYRFLRIPQSIIDELIASNGASLVQPRSAGNINDIVETLAFDFIRTPEIKRSLRIVSPKDEHLLNFGKKLGLIHISKFESNGLGKPSADDADEIKYLAMVMIDKEYQGKIFNLCEVIFAEKIENGEVYFDFEGVGQEIMVIYLDVYGNEYREVINSSDFKGSK
jgi:site-specific DNA-methyltransferase (adenine-specific)/adenine-specific DNA-methyltransferase